MSQASAKPLPQPNADTQPFWDACNDERLIYQKCEICSYAQFYPRSACVKCKSLKLEWRDAKLMGTVHSFTIVKRAPSPVFEADLPYIVALIDLSDGIRMMMNIIDCCQEDVSIGTSVKIIFEPRAGQKVPQAKLLK